MRYLSFISAPLRRGAGRGLVLLTALLATAPFAAQAQTGGVRIGTAGTPDASAVLDLNSTSKGLLPPRLSTAQRDAIAAPAPGLTIFNTTTKKVNTWNGTSWDASLSATEQPYQNQSVTFAYTSPGTVQTYTVPPGVTSVQVDAKGAQGGGDSGLGNQQYFGLGGRVQATLAVVPGQVLQIRVGGAGAFSSNGAGAAGGYNGGGNVLVGGAGGGATDVRSAGGTLADRLLVAGGGGGSGFGANYSQGGAGGNLVGGNGTSPSGVSATGGSQTAGGSTGGALGTGGSANTGTTAFGGGGGGGYYGGGADASGSSRGGGGGGSSFVTPTGGTGVTMTAGVNSGNGSLTLVPSPGYAAPALSGVNFVNVPGDNLGNHTATQNLNLGANALVGNGGSTGLTIASNGAVATAGGITAGGNVQLGANQLVGNGGNTGLTIGSTGNVAVAADATVGGTVGIGPGSQAASAVLDVRSSTKGVLPPRLTQDQRNAITSPATGLTLYNTTTNKLSIWNGASWDEALSATQQPISYSAQTFTYTSPGTVQTYTVPPGVTSVQVDAKGAQGGEDLTYGNKGGRGARVQATLAVTPGQVLQVRVGQVGGFNTNSASPIGGGDNGGGGVTLGGAGGGATDLRSTGGTLADRLLVAGGGGGGGYSGAGSQGGAGGAPTGSNGLSDTGATTATGGTQAAGGSTGGALGTGGASTSTYSGGGGGGGYYGGGGSSGSSSGGGGGGSSFVTPTGTTGLAFTAGASTGSGSLTITPNPVYAAPTLDGSNFVNVPGDNLGNHTATQNLNLGANALVGNGGSTGLTVSSSGAIATASTLTTAGAITAGGNVQLGANQLVGNGGSTGLSIGSTGNVGIGTTASPTQKLEVIGNTTVTGTSYVSGSVGIGTPTPNSRLSISPTVAEAKLTLYDGGSNTAHYGFGVSGGQLNYHVDVSSSSHVFWAGGKNGNGTELLRIQGNGSVGIGTTPVANARLQVSGTALINGGGAAPNTSNATGIGCNSVYVGNSESEFSNYRGTAGGGFRFFSIAGTGAPTNGNQVAYISGSTGQYSVQSDRRLKTNITPLAQGLRTVLALRPVSYDFHTGRRLENGVVTFLPDDKPVRALGFVAQDLYQVVPEAVERPADDKKAFYTVSYSTLVPVLTQAIQEQQAQIEELKQQNATLKAEASSAKAEAGAAKAQAAQATATLETFEARLRRLESAAGGQVQR